MKKNNSGITLMVLIITIIVLIIIASISVYEGKELIVKSKINTIKTNMLTIQAKAKSYAEEIDVKIWAESDKDTKRDTEFSGKGFVNPSNNINSNYINTNIINSSNYIAYIISSEGLSSMGLDEIKNEQYMVIYDKDNLKNVDVIYPEGIKYKNNTYYTLSSIQEVL